jgi:RHS repeat-associated protein
LGERNANQGYGMPDGVRKKFTGYEKDQETGLDFAQARYYGNGLGRFTSVDPALESIEPTLPQSWNRYSYVLNNPIRWNDPSGMFCCFYFPNTSFLNEPEFDETTGKIRINTNADNYKSWWDINRERQANFLFNGLYMTDDEIYWNGLFARIQIVTTFFQLNQTDNTIHPYDVSGLTDVEAIKTREKLFSEALAGKYQRLDVDSLQKGSQVDFPTDLIPGIGPTKSSPNNPTQSQPAQSNQPQSKIETVFQLINSAGKLSRVKAGKQGFITGRGTAQQIFNDMAKNYNATIRTGNNGMPFFRSGNVRVGIHTSKSGTTIDVNLRGVIYKIRVQ